jgi:hypothetical protein
VAEFRRTALGSSSWSSISGCIQAQLPNVMGQMKLWIANLVVLPFCANDEDGLQKEEAE